MCDAVLTGRSTDEIVEKIKQHGKEVHDIKEMSKEDLEQRKRMIKQV
jgi:predicted small metal-binding protein